MVVSIYAVLCVILLVMDMAGSELLVTISIAVLVIAVVSIGLHFVSHRYYKKPSD